MNVSSEAVVRHVLVRGRVQGVGFRAFIEYEAQRLKLQGWVRNRREGAVEALLSGDAETVRQMIELCRKGPQGAHVDRIEERVGRADEFSGAGFSVLPTA